MSRLFCAAAGSRRLFRSRALNFDMYKRRDVTCIRAVDDVSTADSSDPPYMDRACRTRSSATRMALFSKMQDSRRDDATREKERINPSANSRPRHSQVITTVEGRLCGGFVC